MKRELQVAVARVYRERRLRQALYAGDAGAFTGQGLSDEQVQRLCEFARSNRASLEFYAGVLITKRGGRSQSGMSVLYRALQSVGSEGWVRTWADYYAARGDTLPVSADEEKSTLLEFVAERLPRYGHRSNLVADAVRYEQIKLRLGPPENAQPRAELLPGSGMDGPRVSKPFIIEGFGCDLFRLKVGGITEAADLEPRDTSILFCRHWENGSIITARVTRPLQLLLGMCTGTRTVAEIAREMCGPNGLEASHRGVEAMIEQLANKGVLSMSGHKADDES